MNLQTIMAWAKEERLTLAAQDHRLLIKGRGNVPDALLEQLKIQKPALLAVLEQLCFTCLDEGVQTPAHLIGPEDVLYCMPHALCCQCGEPAEHFSPSWYGYCTDCYVCRNGYAPQWVRYHAIWVCACVLMPLDLQGFKPT